MYKLLQFHRMAYKCMNVRAVRNILTRNLLSAAYHCDEVWESRLNQPLLQNINLEEFYYELDQKFQKTKTLSAIDVDIFVNAIKNEMFDDEMLDLVHKLRLTEDTTNSLPSMSYGVVKTLLKNEKLEDMHAVLDDRLNYGIFLNTHSMNILLDYFWEHKNFVSGTRIASQAMLQEDDEHPITSGLSLLHCYNCLLNGGNWSYPPRPSEPQEEVKIRVKYLRNEFNDNHFDLRDYQNIIGKTLLYLTNNRNDSIGNSFAILGATLCGMDSFAIEKFTKMKEGNMSFIKDIFELIQEDSKVKSMISSMELNPKDVNFSLKEDVIKAIQKCSESDISKQCNLFIKWDLKRNECLHEKEKLFSTIQRMKNIEVLKTELMEKESKLWFFENAENIELEIQKKDELKANEIKPVHRKENSASVDEEYIPPSIRKS